MIRALYTAATGMKAQQLQIDSITNNISNANTTGYKRQRPEFADLMYQTIMYAGTSTSTTTVSPSGLEVGSGVRPVAIQKIFTQGNPKSTNSDLDMMITGDGFFQIQLPDGRIGYTRNGNFTKDQNGNIVSSEGYLLIPNITVPADTTQLTVGTDGIVSVIQAGQTQSANIGQIQISKFINPSGLHALGDNLFINTTASGAPITGNPAVNGLGQIRQKFLEVSNVKLVEEMTALITGQRAYESNSKAITTSDEMLSTVNQLKR